MKFHNGKIKIANFRFAKIIEEMVIKFLLNIVNNLFNL